MLAAHLRRGALVGVVGGLAYGSFVLLVGRPLVAHAETFEPGGASSAVPPVVATIGSGLAGVLWGLLLGVVVFGVLFYALEPAIPGAGAVRSYLLGGAGFFVVSGAPWLGFPPQPPGVEQALDADTRVLWYGLFVLAGTVAVVLSGYLLRRTHGRALPVRTLVAVAPFVLLVVLLLAMPANPVTGAIPADFVARYRAVVVLGQAGLWFVMATLHAWLVRRQTAGRAGSRAVDRSRVSE